jgi:hypothetical protein
VGKSQSSGKGQKAKGVANKGPATKLIPNQPNAMEAQFARLETLVRSMASSMATLVKPTTPTLGDFSIYGFDLGFFYGARFSRPLGPDEIEASISNDHVSRATDDETLVRVLTTPPIIRASARM